MPTGEAGLGDRVRERGQHEALQLAFRTHRTPLC